MLRHDGVYYAYGTAPFVGRTIPVLCSANLVDWRELGDGLQPLAGPIESYWAPEVAYRDGVYYMYYSAGRSEGEEHRLRLACAASPEGPFADEGVLLDPEDPFTIDAHPFRDDDGQWYLFYCRDFLEGERVGTGIVVDRLLDMATLAGDRRVVVRPYADWNLFLENRTWYGRTWDAWYTVEGPFVRKHEERYYCFFSGGAWREPSYGVSYAVADEPLGPYTVPAGDGPLLLRTLPGRVLGPGHASVVASPSGQAEYLVYHGWDADATARLMRIDELRWTLAGPECEGPSLDPRPAPA